MRLHLVGLPSTHTTAAYASCAYTQKVRKLSKMLTARGHEVIIYAGAENDAPCAEHVPVVSLAEQFAWYGPHTPPAYPHLDWNPESKPWRMMNLRAAAEISKRARPHDLVLLTSGSHKGIEDIIPNHEPPNVLCVEYGVGYAGPYTHSAYESAAWMHHVYGMRAQRENRLGNYTGQNYDAVIPNYFDPDEFPNPRLSNRKQARPYLLYMGRVINLKGIGEAIAVAREVGLPLKVAGPEASMDGDTLVGADGTRWETDGIVEYVGAVGIEERARLMANAAVLLAPTLYIEPFGGVAVEAMMSGTPAVTTDWGSFTEIVDEGVTGYRFRTLVEGADAVRAAMALNRKAVRERAMARFSLDAVAPMYERWFDRLLTLWGDGWYEGAAVR